MKANFRVPDTNISTNFELSTNNINAQFELLGNNINMGCEMQDNIINANLEMSENIINADFNVNITPDVSQFVTKDDFDTQIHIQEQIDLSIRASIPTTTSQLINNSNFITAGVPYLVNFYNKVEVENLIANNPTFETKIVKMLPDSRPEKQCMYLVAKKGVNDPDNYDEYVWVEALNKFELVGTDLSRYYTKREMDIMLTGKQDTLSQGTGIALSNINVISINTNWLTSFIQTKFGISPVN